MAADDYSFRTRGAVDDLFYYQIGGGEAVMPPPCAAAPRRSAGLGWNADMMCGNFDIDTTVRNQLNGITRRLPAVDGQRHPERHRRGCQPARDGNPARQSAAL